MEQNRLRTEKNSLNNCKKKKKKIPKQNPLRIEKKKNDPITIVNRGHFL